MIPDYFGQIGELGQAEQCALRRLISERVLRFVGAGPAQHGKVDGSCRHAMSLPV